jgi:UDP-N-acetyl-D-galactosamine dehydrogenase
MDKLVVAVVGLGYVGLPLAIEFGKKYQTIGYDTSTFKINSYRRACDPTGEVGEAGFKESKNLKFTSNPSDLSLADVIIVAVPTPVDEAHTPDLSPLISASTTVGANMKAGVIVVYESTVYPGATEEVCIPQLEKYSNLKWKTEFHVGYSPERVNPGDKERTITKIVKVVAGDDGNTTQLLGDLYSSVITAGVYQTSTIAVAEAAKVIENTQRDLNIALMNELSIIFNRMNIDTQEVLDAAATKWNFLPFKPGLVGGHCIGVDPYYLTHKAEMLGYHPQVILGGRKINDGMPAYIAQQVIKEMIHGGCSIKGAKIIVLGLTFKENCPDLRNSKVADLVRELEEFDCEVFVHDPIANAKEALHEYGITLKDWEEMPKEADAIVAAVTHNEYLANPISNLLDHLKAGGVFADIKSTYPRNIANDGFRLWRL